MVVPYKSERDKFAVACAHMGTILSGEPMTKPQADKWKKDLERAVLTLKAATLPKTSTTA